MLAKIKSCENGWVVALRRLCLGVAWCSCVFIFADTDLAQSSDTNTGSQAGTTEIRGNVTVNVQTGTLNATSTPSDPASTAENCIGVIGGDVKITGNITINRSGPAGDCTCQNESVGCQ